MEEFKEIPGYEGLYEVSNYGTVRSLDREISDGKGNTSKRKGKVLKYFTDRDGYKSLGLSKNSKVTNFKVHRLVASTFNPVDGMEDLQVRHQDHNPANNRLSNLLWGTNADNVVDKVKADRVPKGEAHFNSIFTEAQVIQIRDYIELGFENKEIVAMMDTEVVNTKTTSMIRTGRSWGWLTGIKRKIKT